MFYINCKCFFCTSTLSEGNSKFAIIIGLKHDPFKKDGLVVSDVIYRHENNTKCL